MKMWKDSLIIDFIFYFFAHSLMITYNALLLRYVHKNSIPRSSTNYRSHYNEDKLSRTILLVNTIVFVTIIPQNVISLMTTLHDYYEMRIEFFYKDSFRYLYALFVIMYLEFVERMHVVCNVITLKLLIFVFLITKIEVTKV